jgi:hypothetical protein
VYLFSRTRTSSVSYHSSVERFISLPALEAENARAVNEDGRHEAALLLDRAVNREATGRSVRAIEAMTV